MVEISPIPESEMEHLVTPFFKHMAIENVPQSERQRRQVTEIREVVELRFAGDKNYSPVFPADAMYRRDGHDIITYAERFQRQYLEFQAGASQQASGTPLERLIEHGITPAQLSMCRAAKVYSIEALHALEKPGLNTLGQSANSLKEMARAYMADRSAGFDTAAEMAKLREELAALKAGVIPAVDPTPVEIDAAVQAADDEFETLTDAELKDRIKELTGVRPQGNPSRATLLATARELAA